MAKYKCLEGNGCIHNNHGWCKVLKKNGLKNVKECSHFDDGTEVKQSEVKDDNQEMLLEIGRVIGKREMFYTIQRQFLAKGSPITLEELNELSKLLLVEETIYEVDEHEMMIQADMRVASINIANKYPLKNKD